MELFYSALISLFSLCLRVFVQWQRAKDLTRFARIEKDFARNVKLFSNDLNHRLNKPSLSSTAVEVARKQRSALYNTRALSIKKNEINEDGDTEPTIAKQMRANF